MKKNKKLLYVIIVLFSCTVASQQFAMDRYGNIRKNKTQEQRDAYKAAQEKQRQCAAEKKIRELKEKEAHLQRQRKAEERIFKLEQRQKAIDIDGYFFAVGMDDELVRYTGTKIITQKRSATPTQQPSVEQSPISFIDINDDKRASSSTTTRGDTPFRPISIVPIKDRSDSPITLAANGGKSSFTPAETLLTRLIIARKSLKKAPCSSNFMDIEQ